MKRTLLSILYIAASICASAEVVSENTAAEAAKAFFGSNATLVQAATNSLRIEGKDTKSGLEAPAFYVFNNPGGGWVIIAGEDSMAPVLAYNPTGTFPTTGQLPSNIRSWLSNYSRGVKALRSKRIEASSETRLAWKQIGVSTKAESIKLLSTAAWSQDSPYNDFCPTVTGEKDRSVTGCVATAMAIICRHHKWPETAQGTLGSYTTETAKYKVNGYSIEGKNYDIANIPLTDGSRSSSGWTAQQKKNVADLMKDCGVMVKMDYSSEGSGAYSSEIAPAMGEHLRFNKGAKELYRDEYSNQEWFRMIKAEIDADCPVLYGGVDKSSNDGHQFVCDGYSSDWTIHINWGWGGTLNGWYAVSYIGDKDKNKVNDVFSYMDSGIFGLRPDTSGDSKPEAELTLYRQSSYIGISLNSGSIVKGSEFTIKIGVICNMSLDAAYEGALKAGLYDKDGNLKQYIGNELPISINKATLSGQYTSAGTKTVSSYPCTITADIALGDHIRVAFRMPDGSWQPISSDNLALNKLGVFDIPVIRVPESITQTQVIYPEVITGHKLVTSISWTYDGSTVSNEHIKAGSAGVHSLKATIIYSDGSSEIAERKIKVN